MVTSNKTTQKLAKIIVLEYIEVKAGEKLIKTLPSTITVQNQMS